VTYTQGPWTIESMSNDLNDGQAEVILANRKTIAWTSNTEVSPIDPMYERLNDDGLLDGSCGYTSDEDRANARLIASAPDLLEALNKAISELTLSLNFEKGYPDTIQVVKQGMEARKKATGQDDDIEYPEVEA